MPKLTSELKPAYLRSVSPKAVETRMAAQLDWENLSRTGPRTDSSMSGETVQENNRHSNKMLIKWGAGVLLAVGAFAGAMEFAQLRGGSETPISPIEAKQHVDENGHLPTNRN